MRALIDVPERQLKELEAICAARKLSRAEGVRQAVAAFIQQNRPSREEAFGLWKGQAIYLPEESEPLPEDGLAYQEKLRSEW
jgi:metal-responsive CopG/Arc/MetJ family transcriptional regulator